ncbi:MAG: anthrone oxygenase family protein [Mycobacterium sp.]
MTTSHTDTATTESAADPADRPALLQTTSAFAAVLFSGLFAGFLTTVLVFEASLRDFGAAVYTQVRLIELEHLDDLATALLAPAILAAAALMLAMIRRRHSGRWLALTAVLLLLASLAISVSISVPINTDQQSWSVLAPPGDWSNVRDRWQVAHAARTTTAVLAFVLLTSTVVPPSSSRKAAQASRALRNNQTERPTP